MNTSIHLYNTATRKKEIFETQTDEIGMYCCGPTVYNYAHIGNLRTYVFEDVLKRTLKLFGHEVKHVVNITDVGHLVSDADTGDDKMETGAQREGKTVWEIAKEYTDAFMENIADLNIVPADIWPRATDHIDEMIDQVQILIDKGFTYQTSDGIYFDTTTFDKYCSFAKLDPESLQAGSRVEMGEKKNPTDFALWKFSPKDKKRQMEWQSPWGIGFPGWHIECSAMSLKYLSQPLDIHCGGIDHIRVHHTNEIAQAEAATGKPFSRFWLHGEFLSMETGKMAKSSGNFITLHILKEKGYDPLAYRAYCFTAHYRSPLTFSWDGLDAASNSLKNLKKAVSQSIQSDSKNQMVDNATVEKCLEGFYKAVADDLNMPRAIAAIWELSKDTNISPWEKAAAFEKADRICGLNLLQAPQTEETVFEINGLKISVVSEKEIESTQKEYVAHIVAQRAMARKNKNWDEADRLRDELKNRHVEIRDGKDGITECIIT